MRNSAQHPTRTTVWFITLVVAVLFVVASVYSMISFRLAGEQSQQNDEPNKQLSALVNESIVSGADPTGWQWAKGPWATGSGVDAVLIPMACGQFGVGLFQQRFAFRGRGEQSGEVGVDRMRAVWVSQGYKVRTVSFDGVAQDGETRIDISLPRGASVSYTVKSKTSLLEFNSECRPLSQFPASPTR